MLDIEPLEARRLCSGVWAVPAAGAHAFFRDAATHLASVRHAAKPGPYVGSWTGSYHVTRSTLDPNVTVLVDTQSPQKINGILLVGEQSTRFSASGLVQNRAFAYTSTTATGILVSVAGTVADGDNSASGEITFTVGAGSITLAFELTRAVATG